MPKRVIKIVAVSMLCMLMAGTASAVLTEAKLVDASGGSADHFGWAVAMDGDYVIVGAPNDATQGANAGKAVIYFFNGTNWVQQADLFPSSNPAEGRFGYSVDIDGDLAVVGAPYFVAGGTSTGLAYVFRRSGISSWSLDGLLFPADGSLDDHYGSDVAVHAGTVAVGAPGHTSTDDNDGAVYVYLAGGGPWILEKKLDGEFGPGTAFGSRLDVWGDWLAASRSGFGTPGYVHTFRRDARNGWVVHRFFDASDSAPSDGFGRSVELYNERLLIGAHQHNHGASEGAGYVIEYFALAGSWPEKDELLEVSAAAKPDNLGWSAGLEGDLAAVGALYGDGIATDSGLVYVYRRASNDSWYEIAALTANDGFTDQSFGYSSGVSGDCVIVGAISDDDQGTFAGAAYVYCGLPLLAFLVDINIICCIQIPDHTTGPVEFDIRFENVSMQPRTITHWVDLIRPDGDIVQVVRPVVVEVLEGGTYQESFETMILAADPPGDYTLAMYWQEGEDVHTETAYFSVVSSVPLLQLVGMMSLASGVVWVGLRALQRRSSG